MIVLYEDLGNIDDHQTKSQTRQNVKIFNRPLIFLATPWTDSSEFNTLIHIQLSYESSNVAWAEDPHGKM
jgi:hypothetical protein